MRLSNQQRFLSTARSYLLQQKFMSSCFVFCHYPSCFVATPQRFDAALHVLPLPLMFCRYAPHFAVTPCVLPLHVVFNTSGPIALQGHQLKQSATQEKSHNRVWQSSETSHYSSLHSAYCYTGQMRYLIIFSFRHLGGKAGETHKRTHKYAQLHSLTHYYANSLHQDQIHEAQWLSFFSTLLSSTATNQGGGSCSYLQYGAHKLHPGS